jgi:membrane peptidoglycan carboxypeptidase
VVGRTVNGEVAAELTTIMELVVERGTGKAAKLPGYTVAGKTGTAARIINGHYSTSDYNASFVGFVPSRKPVFTIIVVINSPHAKGHTGGVAAAPVFNRIADAALRYQGVPPTLNAPPPILVARHEDDDEIHEQPASGPVKPSIVPIGSAATSGAPVFPALIGLSARDALRVLARLGVPAQLHGAGVVVEQRPDPGSALESGVTATLWLDRQRASIAAAGIASPPERTGTP